MTVAAFGYFFGSMYKIADIVKMLNCFLCSRQNNNDVIIKGKFALVLANFGLPLFCVLLCVIFASTFGLR
jgi:hypothetical protein